MNISLLSRERAFSRVPNVLTKRALLTTVFLGHPETPMKRALYFTVVS